MWMASSVTNMAISSVPCDLAATIIYFVRAAASTMPAIYRPPASASIPSSSSSKNKSEYTSRYAAGNDLSSMHNTKTPDHQFLSIQQFDSGKRRLTPQPRNIPSPFRIGATVCIIKRYKRGFETGKRRTPLTLENDLTESSPWNRARLIDEGGRSRRNLKLAPRPTLIRRHPMNPVSTENIRLLIISADAAESIPQQSHLFPDNLPFQASIKRLINLAGQWTQKHDCIRVFEIKGSAGTTSSSLRAILGPSDFRQSGSSCQAANDSSGAEGRDQRCRARRRG